MVRHAFRLFILFFYTKERPLSKESKHKLPEVIQETKRRLNVKCPPYFSLSLGRNASDPNANFQPSYARKLKFRRAQVGVGYFSLFFFISFPHKMLARIVPCLDWTKQKPVIQISFLWGGLILFFFGRAILIRRLVNKNGPFCRLSRSSDLFQP